MGEKIKRASLSFLRKNKPSPPLAAQSLGTLRPLNNTYKNEKLDVLSDNIVDLISLVKNAANAYGRKKN